MNHYTTDKTSVSILNDFKDEGLHDPNFVVYPQMSIVSAEHYYKGRFGVDLSEETSSSNHSQVQLTNQDGVNAPYINGTKSITIDNAMDWISHNVELPSNEAICVTAIVASAGSGKTTLLRRIAQRALSIPVTTQHATNRRQRMVYYIELKDIQEENFIKPSRFLFHGHFPNEVQEDQAFEWLVNNQSEATIFFDGLDQAKWEFHGNNIRNMKSFERGSTSKIMYNILARNILRHVKIFITSREFKISELPALARPRNIITLKGLTIEDAQMLFIFLLGKNGRDIWDKIETMSPRLLHLITVPVFLILTAIVMGKDPNGDPPSTVTKLYNRIVSNLQSLENIRNRDEIFAIIIKLKAMAYQGMKEGRVIFQQTDMQQFGLSSEQVQDLMTKVPGKKLLSRHLLEGDFNFYFCHQSIQEFLAASFVAEMSFDDFSHFDDVHLHGQRWSVVRRFIAGIVFSKSTIPLHRVTDNAKKQDLLSRSIMSQLDKNEADRSKLMELYTVIYESNNDNLMRSLFVINADVGMSTIEQAHIVKTLIVRCRDLDYLELDLIGNYSSNSFLESIVKSMKNQSEEMRDSDESMSSPLFRNVRFVYNKRSARSLGSFFGFRSGFPSNIIDWRVASFDGWEIVNADDVIKISDDMQIGRYYIQESKLKFEKVTSLEDVKFFLDMIEPKSSEIPHEDIHVEQDVLRDFSHNLEIKKMVLLIKVVEDIDWPLILDSIAKYQVKVLDIAVSGQESHQDTLQHVNEISNSGVNVNIHWMLCVKRAYDISLSPNTFQQNQIGYTRFLISNDVFRLPHCDIYHLTKNDVGVKNRMTLVYDCDGGSIRNDDTCFDDYIEIARVKRMTSESGIKVLNAYRDGDDVWVKVEDSFCEEGMDLTPGPFGFSDSDSDSSSDAKYSPQRTPTPSPTLS